MTDTTDFRRDIAGPLRSAGWTPSPDDPTVLCNSGASWGVISPAGDSTVVAPGGWEVTLPSNVPPVAVITLCMAAAENPFPRQVEGSNVLPFVARGAGA